jgi:hypothetical protein
MNTSWMFFQDKGNGKKGTAAMRGLHRICPWGKAIGKAITQRGPMSSLPHYCHGCVQGRRKETALLVQLCGSWRLKKCGLSHITSFFDQANAFPSVSFRAQQDTDNKTIWEDDKFISEASIFDNTLQIDASDETIFMHNQEGCLQGHQTAPLKYVRTFSEQVLEPWLRTLKLISTTADYMETTCPDGIIASEQGVMADLSITVFVDDTALKTVSPPNNDAHTLNGMTHIAQATLSEHVATIGGALNEDKTAHVITAAGKNMKKLLYELHHSKKFRRLRGTTEYHTRYLGNRFSASTGTHDDRPYRKRGMEVGWYSMGKFWRQRKTKLRVKTTVFRSRVQSAGLMGQEAYVYLEADAKQIDSTMLKYGRKLLGGGSCIKQRDLKGNIIKHRSLTNKEVFAKIKLVPAMLEMRIRRIKWMQAVAKDTSNHIQLLCALFGRMKCENADTVVEGKLTEYANP